MALLGGLDQVQPCVAAVLAGHRQRETADLADRLGDAVEEVGAVVDEPVAAELAAGLLVGKNANTRSRGGTMPSRLKWRATAIIMPTMSFMSIAPRPQT